MQHGAHDIGERSCCTRTPARCRCMLAMRHVAVLFDWDHSSNVLNQLPAGGCRNGRRLLPAWDGRYTPMCCPDVNAGLNGHENPVRRRDGVGADAPGACGAAAFGFERRDAGQGGRATSRWRCDTKVAGEAFRPAEGFSDLGAPGRPDRGHVEFVAGLKGCEIAVRQPECAAKKSGHASADAAGPLDDGGDRIGRHAKACGEPVGIQPVGNQELLGQDFSRVNRRALIHQRLPVNYPDREAVASTILCVTSRIKSFCHTPHGPCGELSGMPTSRASRKDRQWKILPERPEAALAFHYRFDLAKFCLA